MDMVKRIPEQNAHELLVGVPAGSGAGWCGGGDEGAVGDAVAVGRLGQLRTCGAVVGVAAGRGLPWGGWVRGSGTPSPDRRLERRRFTGDWGGDSRSAGGLLHPQSLLEVSAFTGGAAVATLRGGS